jgi:hypothetical protein
VLLTWWSVGMALAEEPAEEGSGGVTLTFNEDFELRYWLREQRLPAPDDVPIFNYVEQVNRLNGTAQTGKWTFAVQVDEVALFADRYYLDEVLYLENDLTAEGLPTVFPGRLADTAYLNVEKLRVTFEDDWGSISLGDSYVAFGRGAALNLNRNVDIDIDTSIQGAKALLRPGSFDITLVAGQANRQQVFQDNPNGLSPFGTGSLIQGDFRHLIAGARAELFGLGPANLGAHGVIYDFVDDPGFPASLEPGPLDVAVAGATAELIGVAGLDTFAEADLYSFGPDMPSPLGEDAPGLGHALYVSTSGYPGPFVVLLEGKRYYQAERVNSLLTPELYEVAIAPTLEYERVITEDSSATLNSSDVWGGRVQVDWAAVPGKLVPYVAVGVFRDLELGGLHFNDAPETVVHPMGGLEWIDGEFGLLANGGVRTDDRDGADTGADQQIHGDLSLNFPLPGELIAYVSAQAERFHWGVNPLQQEDYFETETGYTLTWKSKVSVTAFLDYTTNPLVNTTGNVSEPLYLAGELQIKPVPAWTLKAFAGAQKAGIRCSGGQCRQLPGFEGFRVSAVGSF